MDFSSHHQLYSTDMNELRNGVLEYALAIHKLRALCLKTFDDIFLHSFSDILKILKSNLTDSADSTRLIVSCK